MKHIVVLNPKGGCGKTTIATHLAVYASTLGLNVALADHDKQQSSCDWLKSRPRRCADIAGIAAYDGEAISGDYEVVIHDMPAGVARSQMSIASACDKLIIPLTPSPIDIKAALRFWMTLSNTGWLDDDKIDIGIVANRVKANTKYTKTFDSFIERIGIPRIATLRDTQNYIRSLDSGLSLFDLPPGRVAKDIIQWEPLMEWTGFFDMDDDELSALLQSEALGMDTLSSGNPFNSSYSDNGDNVTEEKLVSFEDMQLEQLEEEMSLDEFTEVEY
jgi:chromosome partitioning protein